MALRRAVMVLCMNPSIQGPINGVWDCRTCHSGEFFRCVILMVTAIRIKQRDKEWYELGAHLSVKQPVD